MIPGLTDSLDFNGKALMLQAEKQRLIASNIANADTPGYQARDFDFAAALRSATGTSSLGRGIARNVMSSSGADGGVASPELLYAIPSQTNLDSNTVDMDRERSASVENSLKYEATLRFINDDYKDLTTAMKSASQS
jgi:flagellar basal-body rod protein FlgB